jgi:hypothetical protein
LLFELANFSFAFSQHLTTSADSADRTLGHEKEADGVHINAPRFLA